MEYYHKFVHWVGQTALFKDVLCEMPAPFNNPSFDTIFLLLICVYVIYRMIVFIRIRCFHKRSKKQRRKQEQQILEREQQLQEKEEKIGLFYDRLESYFAGRRTSGSLHGRKRLGNPVLLLGKARSDSEREAAVQEKSDYDRMMSRYVHGEQLDEEVNRQLNEERERTRSNLNEIDLELKRDFTENESNLDIEVVSDVTFDYADVTEKHAKDRTGKKAHKHMFRKVSK